LIDTYQDSWFCLVELYYYTNFGITRTHADPDDVWYDSAIYCGFEQIAHY
jgi:hypothetical protein